MVKSMFNGMGWRMYNCYADGIKQESDMIGCSHCTKLMYRKLWADDGGYCHGCGEAVCGPCCDLIPKTGCTVFVKTLELSLKEEYRRSQNARILGI